MFATAGSRRGQGKFAPKIWGRSSPITRVEMTNGQVIGTGGEVTLVWDTLVRDDVGCCFGTPLNMGYFMCNGRYNRVRASWHSTWNGVNGSTRRMVFYVNNGSTWTNMFDDSQASLGFNAFSRVMQTRWYNIGPAYMLAINAFQDTGANLTFSPAGNGQGQAWLEFEWAIDRDVHNTSI